MNKRDYYEVLNITRDTSLAAIKKAYRKLAHKYHPDRNKDEGAEDKFKEASEAYEVLSDPQKKESYDAFGHSSLHGPTQRYTNPFNMFNSFFGEGRPQQGRDLRVEISISLENVLTGIKKSISYMRYSICKECEGVGGTGICCKMCAGYGQVRQQNAFVQVITTCPTCQGSRIEITQKCQKCEGAGEVGEKHTIDVEIPAGVRSGDLFKVAGEGDLTENDLPPGDLICRISVEPHPIFQRKNKDVQCSQEISFVNACLGVKIMIPTLGGGKEEFTIPPGTQFGQSFRIKGKGLPTISRSHKVRGDQFVKIRINVPKKLTPKEQDLLKQFGEKNKD